MASVPAAAKKIPVAATPAPCSSAPVTAVPAVTIAAAVAAPVAHSASTSTARWRATTDRSGTRPASSRSQRPSSSWPRVIRVAASSPHTPPSTPTTWPVRHTANPPGSSRATGSPNRVAIAGFPASAVSAATSAGSDNVPA